MLKNMINTAFLASDDMIGMMYFCRLAVNVKAALSACFAACTALGVGRSCIRFRDFLFPLMYFLSPRGSKREHCSPRKTSESSAPFIAQVKFEFESYSFISHSLAYFS